MNSSEITLGKSEKVIFLPPPARGRQLEFQPLWTILWVTERMSPLPSGKSEKLQTCHSELRTV
ncbi:MAG: hypothetical protein QM523_03470, partial [Candidatus Pacebacteria bacterium]|nr:hypothetical protein [Candidatus Paceibacterota bacterium]